MSKYIYMPKLGANDEEAILVKWLVVEREYIKEKQPVCIIETTKTTSEVEAEHVGYIHFIISEQNKTQIGSPIAILTESQTLTNDMKATIESNLTNSSKRWTKKAEIIAKKLNIDIEALAANYPGKTLIESDIHNSKSLETTFTDLIDDKYTNSRQKRIIILGGGAGAGAIILDIITRTKYQRAVAILDNNKAIHGKSASGVPIVGANEAVVELWEKNIFDAAIIAVTTKIKERMDLFEMLAKNNIPCTNIIDPTAMIMPHVVLGSGNLIFANCFLGLGVILGNNNFLASHTCIEHHSIIGNNTTFGPRCTTSGAVKIGNNVKFGIGVLIEPYLSINDDALIPSGSIVTTDIPAGSVLKSQNIYTVKNKEFI